MPREDTPEELIDSVRDAAEPWVTKFVTDEADGSRGPMSYVREADEIARAVLSAASEAGWVRAEDLAESERMRDSLRWERDGVEHVRQKDNAYLLDARDKARAHAENLAEALDELLIGGADAVSMEHAKRAAKVVLRSYRKARDAS